MATIDRARPSITDTQSQYALVSLASETLSKVNGDFASYEQRLHAGSTNATKLPVPTQITLPEGVDSRAFATQMGVEADYFRTKTKVIDVSGAISSDNTFEAAQRALQHFGRSFSNAFVLMLETMQAGGEQAGEAQDNRREQLFTAVAELAVPSLIVFCPEQQTAEL